MTVLDRLLGYFDVPSMPPGFGDPPSWLSDDLQEAWAPPELSMAASAPPGPMVAAVAPKNTSKEGGSLSQRAPIEQEWQERAWAYYRRTGEARQAVNWMAHGVSRCHLYIGKVPDAGTGDPAPVDDPGLAGEVLAELHDGPIGQSAMLERLAIHLLVPGESWLAGYPRPKDPDPDEEPDEGVQVDGLGEFDDGQEVDNKGGEQADDVELDEDGNPRTAWAVLSRKEWQEGAENSLRLKLPKHPRAGADGWVDFAQGQVALVPVYTPDAEDSTMATSAFEAALDTLDELDGLSRRVGADIFSRLVTAGVLPIPESATLANPGASTGINPIGGNPFVAALLAAAKKLIDEPGDPSARVPVVVTVPDEAGPIKLVDFATAFDAQIPVLREAARKTLAADLDIPSSVVLGVEDLNHWSTWSVQDDAIRAHLGPLISRICTALTIEILWPALRAAGDKTNSLCIWWSAQEITQRPDRSTVALAAHKQDLISDQATRREIGFDEEDAPSDDELAARRAARGGEDQGEDDGTPDESGGQAEPGETPNPPEKPEAGEESAAASRRTGTNGAHRRPGRAPAGKQLTPA